MCHVTQREARLPTLHCSTFIFTVLSLCVSGSFAAFRGTGILSVQHNVLENNKCRLQSLLKSLYSAAAVMNLPKDVIIYIFLYKSFITINIIIKV